MIIDAILDRKDGVEYTIENAKYIYDEAMLFKIDYLSTALDYGDNVDVQKALCHYVIDNLYNPDLCSYIMSVNWI